MKTNDKNNEVDDQLYRNLLKKEMMQKVQSRINNNDDTVLKTIKSLLARDDVKKDIKNEDNE